MSLVLAIYIAMPYLLYQLWMFTAPALYRHEKKLILPLVVSSTMLFYIGLLFSFYIVFPVIFTFLSSVGPELVDFAPDIQYYLDFILKVSFAFGVAFEVPIATILLIMFGATTAERLKKKSCLHYYWLICTGNDINTSRYYLAGSYCNSYLAII